MYNIFVFQQLLHSTSWRRRWPKRQSWGTLQSSVPTTRLPLLRHTMLWSCGSLLKTWSIHIWECCAGKFSCDYLLNICPFLPNIFIFDHLFTVLDSTWLQCITTRMLIEDKPPRHHGILCSDWAFQRPGRESAEPNQWRPRPHSVSANF